MFKKEQGGGNSQSGGSQRPQQGIGQGQGNKSQEEVKLFGTKVDSYADLLKDDEADDELSELAKITMGARVQFECSKEGGKKEVFWHQSNQTPGVSFTLTGKNFAAIQLEWQGKKTTPRGFESAPGKESTGYPSEHAERYALADAINQLIDAGWKPRYQGKELEKLTIPPKYEDLQKFTDALKWVSSLLFTEKSFCTETRLPSGEINCNEGLSKILSGEKHKVYYAVVGNTEDSKLKAARVEYYKNTKYEAQSAFLAKNKPAVETVTEDNTKRVGLEAKKGSSSRAGNLTRTEAATKKDLSPPGNVEKAKPEPENPKPTQKAKKQENVTGKRGAPEPQSQPPAGLGFSSASQTFFGFPTNSTPKTPGFEWTVTVKDGYAPDEDEVEGTTSQPPAKKRKWK